MRADLQELTLQHKQLAHWLQELLIKATTRLQLAELPPRIAEALGDSQPEPHTAAAFWPVAFSVLK